MRDGNSPRMHTDRGEKGSSFADFITCAYFTRCLARFLDNSQSSQNCITIFQLLSVEPVIFC
jgi:hypothetical protein